MILATAKNIFLNGLVSRLIFGTEMPDIAKDQHFQASDLCMYSFQVY